MNLAQFQAFVAQNIGSYSGVHPEAEHSFHRAESVLGCQLPDTLKWLLEVHGYSSACGIASLKEALQIPMTRSEPETTIVFGCPQRVSEIH